MKKHIISVSLIVVIVLVVDMIIGWLLSPAGQIWWGRSWLGRPDGLTAIFTVFAGIGTVGAVIVALFGIRYERRKAQRWFEAEQTRARDELRDERERFEKAQEEDRRQFLESQKQTQAALEEGRRQYLEMQYAANRPLLVPLIRVLNYALPVDIDWSAKYWSLQVKNVGTGIATDIWGVLMPHPISHQYSKRKEASLSPDLSSKQGSYGEGYMALEKRGMICNCDDSIGDYSLCVPKEHAHVENSNQFERGDRCIARLTLTYQDIFGRKHASIFDYTQLNVWINKAFIPNIEYDLGEMNEAKGELFKANAPT